MDKTDLANRMKTNYEDITRNYLPRRTYTIIRLDAKAFHTYTRDLKKPFDKDLMEDFDNATISMLSEIQGVVFAYLQSDEISILLTDFATPNTSAWFDGNIQKISSVSASLITAHFNNLRMIRHLKNAFECLECTKSESDAHMNFVVYNLDGVVKDCNLASFDSRCFTIPDRIEVMNYFRWRQQDCIRNSVSMVAQSKFSHKELNGKSQSDMHEMFYKIGVNWTTDYTDNEKNGRIIVKENYTIKNRIDNTDILRSHWISKGAWVFTKDEGKLLNMIPTYDC